MYRNMDEEQDVGEKEKAERTGSMGETQDVTGEVKGSVQKNYKNVNS